MPEGKMSTGWAGRDGTRLEGMVQGWNKVMSSFSRTVWFSFNNVNSAKNGQVVTKFAKYTIL
ncbi:unnamed protein product, partial [Bubo scandiacus]